MTRTNSPSPSRMLRMVVAGAPFLSAAGLMLSVKNADAIPLSQAAGAIHQTAVDDPVIQILRRGFAHRGRFARAHNKETPL